MLQRVNAPARLSPSADPGQLLSLTTAAATQAAAAAAQKGVYVNSLLANTIAAYIGLGSGVTTGTGIELQPGDTIFIECQNANQIYAIRASAVTVNLHLLAV